MLDDVTSCMYLATKAADPTRPVIDASGYAHRVPGADVFQEQNGIYRFDRSSKPGVARIRAAQLRPAAIEQAMSGDA